jgi:hypothetical protein
LHSIVECSQQNPVRAAERARWKGTLRLR